MPADPAPRTRRRTVAAVLGLVAVLLALVLTGAGCGAGTASAPGGMSTAGTAAGGVGSGLAPTAPTTDLATVAMSALPPEAVTTLRLIAAGGPYPYAKDGVVFGNRERLLPRRPDGFYREYTVVTPGSGDRGARRVVAGDDGSRFYTDDHYASFREVVDR